MKKLALNALLLGAFVGGMAASANAVDCYPCQPTCCEWSLCDGKVIVGADYLWWKTEQDGLSFGSTTVAGSQSISAGGTGSSSSSSGSSVVVDATFTTNERPSFEFDSGYRVYAGYEFPCDQWELGVSYTYVPTSTNRRTLTASETVVIDAGIIPVLSVTGKWNANLNMVDVDVARTLKFGECFRLRPHVGFRAVWGDQKFHSTILTAATTGNESVFHFNQKNHAYGIEGGVFADWNFGCGLSLIGHLGGSILYNNIKVSDRIDTATVAATTTFTGSTTIHDTIHTATPTLDYFIGLNYGDSMCDFSYNLYVGYEAHVFFDYGRLFAAGNYSTQGLTAGLNVGF